MKVNNINKEGAAIPKHLIIFGGLLIVLAIVFVVLIMMQDTPTSENNNSNQVNQQTDNTNNTNNSSDNETFDPEEDYIEVVDSIDGAIATTAGSNLITRDGNVVNEKGQVVQNNALPMTDEAPRLSQPIDNADALPEGVVKITADESGFSPNQFTVKSGEPVTISLTAQGVGSRLVFDSSSLMALEIPVPADYTMAKTFNAPAPGEYTFYQDMPGRTNQTGVMVVIE